MVHIRTSGGGYGDQPRSENLGSGVVIDRARGYIVTNNHVVKDADIITIRVGRITDMAAELVGGDPKTDLAVLKVKGVLPSQADWGDSDKVDIGDWVLAIGSPFGLDRSVTAGIVSATSRGNLPLPIMGDNYQDFIQTDAAINPGNSGGPLISLQGKVIGINTAIFSESGGSQGIGLAISSRLARKIVDQLIQNGKVTRGFLGVMSQELNSALAKEFGVQNAEGAIVTNVLPESPAAKGGLKAGDVLVSIAGNPVKDPSALRNLTSTLEVGSKVEIGYLRDGKTQAVEVTIAELPETPVVAYLGFEVQDAPADRGGGLFVSRVEPGSPAERSGLRVGSRIASVGRRPVKTKAEYDQLIHRYNAADGVPLGIQLPGGRIIFLNVSTIGSQR